MGALEAASSIIASLAWPAVVMVAVVVLRLPLRALLGRLRTYEGAGQKVTFGEQVERLEGEAELQVKSTRGTREASKAELPNSEHSEEASGPHSPDELTESLSGRSNFANVVSAESMYDHLGFGAVVSTAALSAPAAVLASWRGLERTIASLYSTVLRSQREWRESSERIPNTGGMLTYLLQEDVISPPVSRLIISLKGLRDNIAHSKVEIAEGEALAYAEITFKIEKMLEELRRVMHE